MRKRSNELWFSSGVSVLIRLMFLSTFVLPSTRANMFATEIEKTNLQEIVVEEEGDLFRFHSGSLERAALTTPNTAEVVATSPGAAVIENGPITGDFQYRGLDSQRVQVLIDGMEITPVGPNRMDAPFQIAPPELLQQVEVTRGIAPLSTAGGAFGGSAEARFRTSHYTDAASLVFDSGGSFLFAGVRTNRAAERTGFLLSFGSHITRLHFRGSFENGEDRKSSRGVVLPSGYKRKTLGIGFARKRPEGEWGADYYMLRTDDFGNASLPMDAHLVESHIGRLFASGIVAGFVVDGNLYFTAQRHVMDNFRLRPDPGAASRRNSDHQARNIGWSIQGTRSAGNGILSVGADGHFYRQLQIITNPSNQAFQITNFNHTENNRYGMFIEWSGSVKNGFNLGLGARLHYVQMNADPVSPPPTAAARTLAARFNSANRRKDEKTLDLFTSINKEIADGLEGEIQWARKSRSPSFFERFSWLPLEVSGGLADGHNYIGNIDLKPETINEIDVGLDWHSKRFRLTPRAFYRRVNGYIQGTPTGDATVLMVSTMNGDANPLQFNNTGAEFYGADAAWTLGLGDHWHAKGTLSFVRGLRTDIADNVYRVAPFHGNTELAYEQKQGAFALEWVFSGKQDRVSKTNGETPTSGWGVINLRGEYRPTRNLKISLAVNNVFDHYYASHLNGFNRVSSSSVPPGNRIPEDGRHISVTTQYRF